MDQLPDDYSYLLLNNIATILEPYELKDLIQESLNSNVKAQKAVLQKFQIGCHEVKHWSILMRVSKILEFWIQIKIMNYNSGPINESYIVDSIKEALFGDYFYNLNGKIPEREIIFYAIGKMKEYEFEENSTNSILNCYEQYKPKPPDVYSFNSIYRILQSIDV